MEQYGTNSKLSFGCKVRQIRALGSSFETEISSLMMFVYVFSLFIGIVKKPRTSASTGVIKFNVYG